MAKTEKGHGNGKNMIKN